MTNYSDIYSSVIPKRFRACLLDNRINVQVMQRNAYVYPYFAINLSASRNSSVFLIMIIEKLHT